MTVRAGGCWTGGWLIREGIRGSQGEGNAMCHGGGAVQELMTARVSIITGA